MFSALWKLFAVIGYALTGRINKAREVWNTDPNVISATMDEVIATRGREIDNLLDAISEVVNLRKTKNTTLETTRTNLKKKQQIRSAARGMTEQRIASLKAQGASPEAIKSDPEFMRHTSAYTTVSAEVEGLEKQIEQLLASISADTINIDKYTVQLRSMQRELESKKDKKAQLVARAVTAAQEERINRTLAGLDHSRDSSAQKEAELDAAVGKLEARAEIAGVVAGTDTARQDAEYLDYAQKNAAVSEFDSLIYGSQTKEDAAKGKDTTKDTGVREGLDA